MTEVSTSGRPAMVGLAVYMVPELAEVSRALNVLVRQRLRVERFDANLATIAADNIRGLDPSTSVMCLEVVGAITHSSDVERVTKALNRLVGIHKVVVSPYV